MHHHASGFHAITAHLDCAQLVQASRFMSAGLTTFICTCRINSAHAAAVMPVGAANDNPAAMNEHTRRALDYVTNYPFND